MPVDLDDDTLVEAVLDYSGLEPFDSDEQKQYAECLAELKRRLAQARAAEGLRAEVEAERQKVIDGAEMCSKIGLDLEAARTAAEIWKEFAEATAAKRNAAESQLARCREALEFYAYPFERPSDDESMMYEPVPDYYREMDFGQRAADCLATLSSSTAEGK